MRSTGLSTLAAALLVGVFVCSSRTAHSSR